MSAPFLLHLMRHGVPALEGRMLGRTDCPVTPAGIASCVDQAADLDIRSIVSSDLRRAAACARAVGDARQCAVAQDARWRELDFGDWDGLAGAAIEPQALGRFWDDPDGHPPPNGERWSALVDRVAAAIAALPPGPMLVVTHGGAMRAALALLCGFGVHQPWAFDLPCASLLSLRIWPGPPRSAQIIGLRP